MLGLVLGLGLLVALDPVRLGITLLVISRQRPVQNLLAYGIGSLTACIPTLVVPLTVLNSTQMFSSFRQHLDTPTTSSTVRHIQIAFGVLALSIAALIAVRSWARQRAQLPTAGGNTSTLVLDSKTPTAISRLLGHGQDRPMVGQSAIRRLFARARNAWENGSLWVALVIGLASGPPLEGVLLLLAIVAASGAAIGAQVSATIAFVVGMLAVIEIVLVGYLTTPAKTLAAVRLVHDWARAHRRQILVAIFAVVGVSMLANGIGIGIGSP
ncbi:GAP family protein [Mycobacterium fragae]|jgi:hypothetical protein|uniref:Gap protein n=1 Tax=Mycobacterium fragae TaxID=1260918 RepID=A0A1X1UFD6_9MYCO|nr:GAP family protein [Mycobacterium fragae]MCV7398946.1 GAP family protein [Mycobacterium fragae]ORV55555.1 gap protein [Mycobacterium fragae]